MPIPIWKWYSIWPKVIKLVGPYKDYERDSSRLWDYFLLMQKKSRLWGPFLLMQECHDTMIRNYVRQVMWLIEEYRFLTDLIDINTRYSKKCCQELHQTPTRQALLFPTTSRHWDSSWIAHCLLSRCGPSF